jgi:predicted nucleic acid-binding protein
LTLIVVDCSVTASWVLPDEVSDVAAGLIDPAIDNEFFVPFLWPAEMSNVMLMAERRGRITATERNRGFAALERLPITVVPFSRVQDQPLIYDLAQRLGLTFYDACYVRLATQLLAPLATFDRAMGAAARSIDVALVV